ncbi:DUF1996 domain-containing protein [Sanguibacter sp. 25GB23B1]|uniref:DUF1996 domain-containing protein n=1 Tax=unclassified Sanguibacter TaxID=2645534 RepID=UPI0032AFEB7D
MHRHALTRPHRPPRSPRRARTSLIGSSLATAALVLAAVAGPVTTAGAADDALISTGKAAIASSSEADNLGPRYAVDGDPQTRWASNAADDQWFRIDLGAPATMTTIVLDWESAYGKDFVIQTSDDAVTWRTVATVTGGTGGRQAVDVSASGRYVQLVAIERGTDYGYSLWELEVYGSGGAASTDPEVPDFDDEVTHHEFQANCTTSHLAPDDPIVFPGQPGRSHLHTFVGNTSTDAHSTLTSLQAAGETTCTVPADLSAYWFPTLMDGDTPVVPNIAETIYYKSGIVDYKKVKPFPLGLKILAGNMMATEAQFRDAPGAVEGYECGDVSNSYSIPSFCAEGSQLNLRYQAPSCWDGVNLDSPDHTSHMAYPVDGQCTLSHPVAVPMLEFKIGWPKSGDMSQVRLVSGADSSWHFDFINAWDPATLDALVKHCINGGLQCDPSGYDQYKPHRGGVLDGNLELP